MIIIFLVNRILIFHEIREIIWYVVKNLKISLIFSLNFIYIVFYHLNLIIIY